MRGPGEIDFGHSRWQEDPTALMQTLRSYLRIKGEAQSPEVVFERGVTQARAAQDQLVARLRRQGSLGGRLKAALAAWFAGRPARKPQIYRHPDHGTPPHGAIGKRAAVSRQEGAGPGRRPVFFTPAGVKAAGRRRTGGLTGAYRRPARNL